LIPGPSYAIRKASACNCSRCKPIAGLEAMAAVCLKPIDLSGQVHHAG
jgi:hypothetical protein